MDDRTTRETGPRPRKAYKNAKFLDSRDARALRILSEYLEPESRFEDLQVQDTIVFFGSARVGSREAAQADLEAAREKQDGVEKAEAAYRLSGYYESARELASRLSTWSQNLQGHEGRFVVCTGGGPGIMEAANRGAAEAGAMNVGLTISLPEEEFENRYVTPELAFRFHYFFMRKFWFSYLAKAVVVMPGGFGTLDELFELMTLMQTLKMKKRLPVVLFGSDFWDEVIDLRALAKFGTIDAEDIDLFHRTNSVDDAYAFITRELSEHALVSDGPTL